MKTSDNITVTDGRLNKALQNQVEPLILPKVTKQVNKAVNDSKFQIGTMTKFYPYLDKCEITLNNSEKIICNILHRFGGEIVDYFTPFGDSDFCDNLKEPCIIPRAGPTCLVLDVNDDTNEQILVGYLSDELLGIDPAETGNIKISMTDIDNEGFITFGYNGLNIRSKKSPSVDIGEVFDEETKVDYANSKDVYTKAEIDKIVEELRKEIHGDDDTDESEG